MDIDNLPAWKMTTRPDSGTSPAPSEYILIVEDEPKLAALHRDYLHQAGFATETLSEGNEVISHIRQKPPELVLLDVMLPGCDGFTILQELRQFSWVPVIMVTARVEEIDRLLGLEHGADDYICKPFSPREVVARVKNILRRHMPGASQADDGLVLDENRFEATLDGKLLKLTRTEFNLLQRLASHPGHIYSRDKLIDAIYEDWRDVTNRAVDSHIKNLRRKLMEASCGMELIHSVYGVGYKFERRIQL